ncbi:hypothetical protein BDV38DRAFT_285035 [Aspergillus pseudotamarii]|uniref:Uncharacterized protein n=1 Tax=Aspergillus pseudotamarii TaxID=132259 RepID=A0A5N6SLH7_ASPPS|nr:uncharacterized protein BDV38DRAFT_285035 [Aspergillus pseudotamarii]KAE8135405.1 hypothetical protein BDV38DRAFT_285035 [Aspergillus pseudotamarii]
MKAATIISLLSVTGLVAAAPVHNGAAGGNLARADPFYTGGTTPGLTGTLSNDIIGDVMNSGETSQNHAGATGSDAGVAGATGAAGSADRYGGGGGGADGADGYGGPGGAGGADDGA